MDTSSTSEKIILTPGNKVGETYFNEKFRYVNKEDLTPSFIKLISIIASSKAEFSKDFPESAIKIVDKYRIFKKLPLKSEMWDIFRLILGDFNNILKLAKACCPEIYNLWIALCQELYINCQCLPEKLLKELSAFKSGRYYQYDVVIRHPLCLMMELQNNTSIYYTMRNDIDMLKECLIKFPRIYDQQLIAMLSEQELPATDWDNEPDIAVYDVEKKMPGVFTNLRQFSETYQYLDPSKKLTQVQLRNLVKYVPFPEIPILNLNLLVDKWGVRVIDTFFNILAARNDFAAMKPKDAFRAFESLAVNTSRYGTNYRQIEYLSFPFLEGMRTSTLDGPWLLNPKKLLKDILCKYEKGKWISIELLEQDLKIASIESNFGPLDFFNNRRTDLQSLYSTITDDYMIFNLGWKNISFPFYMTIVCICAQMGLLSLALDNKLAERDTPDPYLSIRAIRVNDLGHAIINNLDYNPDFNSASKNFKVEFDDDRHIVSLLSPNDPSILFVQRLGKEIAPCRFMITRKSMMKDIDDPEELQARCKEFIDYFKLGENKKWSDYISDILQKSTPLCVSSHINYKDYIISPVDKELIDLIAKNKEIRENCIPGYGYRLFVPADFQDKFKVILRDNGFLI